MVTKDPKKIEHAGERHELAKDIVSIRNYINFSKKTKKQEIQELLLMKKKTETPKINKESREILGRSLEFENDTFKIDSAGWKEIEKTHQDSNGKFSHIRVKISPDLDVFEYLEGPQKGEQIFYGYRDFIYYVAEDKKCTIEEAEDKYLLGEYELKHIFQTRQRHEGIDLDTQEKEFFESNLKNHMAGYYGDDQQFSNINSGASFWLINKGVFYDINGRKSLEIDGLSGGCSGRLLKSK